MASRKRWSRGLLKGREGAGLEGSRRAYAQVRRELRAAVGDALRQSLDAFSGFKGARPKTLRHEVGERARDAVYRDRGLHAADRGAGAEAPHGASQDAPGADGASPDPTSSAQAHGAPPEGEPICTRTMARLLAQQGCESRALRIYDYLLSQEDDEELRQESDAVRARLSES